MRPCQGFVVFEGLDPATFGWVNGMLGLNASLNFGAEFNDWFDSGMLGGDMG
jgi:hypothetical protein